MSYKIDRKDSFYLGSVVIGLIGLGAATLAVAALVLPRFQALRYPAIFDKKFFAQTMISIGTVGAALSFACLLAGHRTKQPPQTVSILGKGDYGTVYTTNIPNIVYKTMEGKGSASRLKSTLDSYSDTDDKNRVFKGVSAHKPTLELEFFIGHKLDHPLFAKSLELFEHGFTMEKAEGEMPQQFDKTAYVKICEQLKEACLHLFDKGIYWADLRRDNILWKRDNNTIKLIDFGAWRIEEDDAERAQYLLLNAYFILRDLALLFAPEAYRKETLYGLKGFENITRVSSPKDSKTLNNLFKNKTKEQMKAILAKYFDVVIKQINSYEKLNKHDNTNANNQNDHDVNADRPDSISPPSDPQEGDENQMIPQPPNSPQDS